MAAEAGQVEIPILPDLSSFGVLLAAGLRGSMGSVQGIFSAISKNWGIALAAGIAAGVGASIKSAVQYEQSFRRVAAITNASTEDLGRWRDQLLEVSSLTAQSPQELADALYFLASAGLKMSDVMGVLKVAAQGSAVGLGDVHTLSLVTAQALNAFSDQGLTAVQAMDALTAAVRAGAVEPDQLAASLGRVMPIADAVGLSFQEVVGGISAMTNAGLDAYESTTALRQLLANVAAPSVEAAGAMSQMGISTQQLRDTLAQGGLLAALDLLGEKSEMNFDVMRRIIPNIRALAGFYNLTRDEMSQAKDVMNQVTNSTGDLSEAFGKTQQNVSFQLERLGNNFEVLKVRAGEAFLPLVNVITNALNGLMPLLGAVANNAHLVVAAFLLWKGLPAIIGGVSAALRVLGATMASEQLAGLNLRQLYYVIAGLAGQVPVLGAMTAALGGLGRAAGTIFVVASGIRGIMNTIEGMHTAATADDPFKILGQNAKIPLNALEALKESSTGFIHNLTVMGHTVTGQLAGSSDLWAEYNEKVASVKQSMLDVVQAGVPLAEVQKNIANHSGAIVDVFKEFPAGSAEAREALDQIISGERDLSEQAKETGLVMAAAINSGLHVGDLIPKFQDAAGVIGLAGMSVQEFGQSAVTAFNKGAPAFNKFISDMQSKLGDAFNEMAGQIAGAVNFANNALSSFAQHGNQSLSTFVSNLTKAGKKTKAYGDDLKEIAKHGGEALVTQLVAMGTEGASAAQRIADGTNKMRDKAIANFNAVTGQAGKIGTELTTKVYGVLNDIFTVLNNIAAHGFDTDLSVDTDKAKSSVAELKAYAEAPLTTTLSVNVDYDKIGSHQVRAAGGPVSSGKAYIVGEEGPELFVPRSGGKIVPNDKLSPRQHAPASGGGGQINVTLSRRKVLDELDRQVRYAGR
jgi:TP901 family phage tail tape measure protein